MIQIAASNLSANLQNAINLGNKISNPNEIGDVDDIVEFKQASSAAEINVAVIKKIIESERLVDVIA